MKCICLFVCFLFKEDKSGGEGSRICRTEGFKVDREKEEEN